jgi:alcohol dehydrogenase
MGLRGARRSVSQTGSGIARSYAMVGSDRRRRVAFHIAPPGREPDWAPTRAGSRRAARLRSSVSTSTVDRTLAGRQAPEESVAVQAPSAATMKALVYHGAGHRAWEDRPRAAIQVATDAVVHVTTSTICGTDLHILQGDLPSVAEGRVLGHEGVGIVEDVGAAVSVFRPGDRVLISCITACGKCSYCRKGMCSHCESGGWILGNAIDGTQAEYVRIPHADTSLYPVPPNGDEEALVMLSDILPTGFECGVLSGCVRPGSSVAIVGAGPVGLAALLTAQFYSPSQVIVIDRDDNRLDVAQGFGATAVVNSTNGDPVARVRELTGGVGVDVAIEAVGTPATFDICQAVLAPGGHLANVGVHGKPVSLHLERLWDRNITLTTRLVDTETTPLLLKMVQSGRLRPGRLITHRFALDDIMAAYDTFGDAASQRALKVILRNERL